uniref:Low-density lipoprotein receptor-related protein 1B-like n=1 Tax=Phallusia mammillata TaxID=59560 RepID=A0A6F9DKK3_9ASCI|nr:low-density lipoprotein receptor-related protein 1B-like [Phallusia mammillata]
MIANPIYRAIFWITAVLALGGNSFVFIATAHSLWNVDRNKNVFIITSAFILNLCCSDFLMGIYLLVVIVQATQFSGTYCLFDKEWRSSSLCSGLGVLSIISSEASAFTMTAMTTFRLISAFKPFTIRSVGVCKVLFAELVCWISAVVLAIVPLLKVTSGYFTTDVWFPNNIFGNDFVSRENMSLLAERIANVKRERWDDVKETIKQTFPRNPIKGEFGYYGETSVCMPRLFATTSEFAWEYSTFLITINFLMFIYMVVAYVLIYKQSNRMKGSRSNDVSSKMQKRISRLILTDFCCWIPICVMGYLSVGGMKMPPDAYVLSACLLLPINSALNPLLYSKAIEDQLVRAKKWLMEKLSILRASTNRSSDLAVRYNAGADEEGDRVVEIRE